MTAHNGKKWTGFPSVPDEKPVWDYLRSLEDRFLVNAPNKLYTTKTANQFKERKGQMDLFFQKSDIQAASTFQYKDVLHVGEQKKSYDTGRFKADLLQITHYVRGVFSDQPTRRFVHALSLCASIMELWVFDRSGAYSSGPFDIHDEPDKFVRAFVGYATMDNEATCLDTFIERKSGHAYVTLDNLSGNKKRFRLERAIIRHKTIVCRGTTCYETRNGHVAKFSWASDKLKLEVEHLKLAEERKVEGIARVLGYCQITTVSDIRSGLEFGKRHRFRNEDVYFDDPAWQSTNTSGQKRASSSDDTSDSASRPKRRSNRKLKLVLEFSNQFLTGKAKPSSYASDEVLRMVDHTYRHDLESFFYVLLWMCARQSWKNGFASQEWLPKESLLRKWEIGSFKSIADAKEGHMTVNGLQRIMSEFPKAFDAVRPLCLRIRKILFPLDKNEAMSLGTPAGDPDQLYRPIIEAYDEAISSL